MPASESFDDRVGQAGAFSERAVRREQILARFEEALGAGGHPVIDAFVSQETDDRPALLAELVHAELEHRLKADEAARVEQYLERYPELASQPIVVVDLICAELTHRRRREPGLTIEEFLERFPAYRRELSERLQNAEPAETPRQVRLRLNCPHCQNPIAVLADSGEADVVCPCCGSTFRVDQRQTVSWQPQHLPRLGKFELLEPVGQGAFGTVYRARDTELDRIVAVKLPRSGVLAVKEDEDRFIREARSVAQLHHPGIVPVHEVGHTDSFPYIVTEYLDGITLADALTGRRFAFRESAEIVAQVAEALEHSHQHGVVHRDLKPSNVMLREEGGRWIAQVMDFGLARREEGEVTVTIEGQVLGTPAYMSPEQARGEGHWVDGRSDVYSLGVILYELLVGELPFRGNARMLLHQVLNTEVQPLRKLNDRIPKDLETICLKCVQKERGRRYTGAQGLADDLRRFLQGQPIRARPVGQAERLWRWCRRNRAVAALAAGLCLALVAGISVSTYLAIEESRRADELAEAYGDLSEARNAALSLADDKQKLADKERDLRTAAEQRLLTSNVLRLVASSRAALPEKPCRSTLLALEAVRLAKSGNLQLVEPEQALREAFSATSGQYLGSHSSPVIAIGLSTDNRQMATMSLDGNTRLWNLTGDEPKWTTLLAEHKAGARTSDDDQEIANSWFELTRAVFSEASNVVFLGKNRRLLANVGGKELRLWDLSPSGRVTSILTVPTGHEIKMAADHWVTHQVAPSDGPWLLAKVTVTPRSTNHEVPSPSHSLRLFDLGAAEVKAVSIPWRADAGIGSISRDGKWLAIASEKQGVLEIWRLDVPEGAPPVKAASWTARVSALELPPYFGTSELRRIAFTSKGDVVAFADASNHQLSLYSIPSAKGHVDAQSVPVSPIRVPLPDGCPNIDHLSGIVISPGDRWLIAAYGLGASRVLQVSCWDLRGRHGLGDHAVLDQQPKMGSFHLSECGRWLISSADPFRRVHFEKHVGLVYGLFPRRRATRNCRVWDLEDPKRRPLVTHGHASELTLCRVSPDGRRLVTADRSGLIQRWDLSLPLPAAHAERAYRMDCEVAALAISRDARLLIAGGVDGTVRSWALGQEDGVEQALLLDQESHVLRTCVGKEGEFFAAAGSTVFHTRVSASKGIKGSFNGTDNPAAVSGIEESRSQQLNGLHGSSVESPTNADVDMLLASPDGRWVLSVDADSNTRIRHDDGDWTTLRSNDSERNVVDAAFTKDSRWLLTTECGSKGDPVRVYDLQSPDIRAAFVGSWKLFSDFHPEVVAVSTNGRLLGLRRKARHAQIWDLSQALNLRLNTSAAKAEVWSGAVSMFRCGHGFVDISSDSRWLAACIEKEICLWDLTTNPPGQRCLTLKGYKASGDPVGLAFSPDSRWLVAAGGGNVVGIWDVSGNSPADKPITLADHQGSITSLAISPDGKWLVTGGSDATARVWRLADLPRTAKPIVLSGHRDVVSCVAISRDSRWVITGSHDGTARLHPLGLEHLVESARRSAGRELTPEERKLFGIDDRGR